MDLIPTPEQWFARGLFEQENGGTWMLGCICCPDARADETDTLQCPHGHAKTEMDDVYAAHGLSTVNVGWHEPEGEDERQRAYEHG